LGFRFLIHLWIVSSVRHISRQLLRRFPNISIPNRGNVISSTTLLHAISYHHQSSRIGHHHSDAHIWKAYSLLGLLHDRIWDIHYLWHCNQIWLLCLQRVFQGVVNESSCIWWGLRRSKFRVFCHPQRVKLRLRHEWLLLPYLIPTIWWH